MPSQKTTWRRLRGFPTALKDMLCRSQQLKKMGAFEYYHTSFSYSLQVTGEERFVGVPEQGGRDLISGDPLPPGTAYTAGVTSEGAVGL